ncbi:22312_t:CDS:2, partial [Dentiscutata erythropus]
MYNQRNQLEKMGQIRFKKRPNVKICFFTDPKIESEGLLIPIADFGSRPSALEG